MVDAAGTAGVFQLLIRDALFVVDKIVAHCAFKQPGVLQNHAEQIVDCLTLHVARSHTVYFD